MQGILYQFFNLILIIVLFAAPIALTVILLRHFGKSKNTVDSEEYLIEKIRDLEKRIEVLEENR
ncbi:hypothetical protein SAMN05660297_01896 [Natronincola peptidivorans]|uniref:Uncharacterized protein n=1 Tax=Natronincola peptidivorans TaxID=426128 RepID=A0A1I0D767_9FIRM|nr:hypothetical protein [Natronincola peptidivorans]SET28062.1 hypothetical protein SAMN05660297_01896 [Natronincola peptidivorans]